MISIIIPTYNRAKTLPRAIESVLAQDYADWELIVVDDGSADGTAKLLEMYADARIRVIRHPANRGVGAAKNTGLDHIRGEWFTILDSDDEIIPGALSAFMQVPAMDHSINAITCNCIDTATGGLTGTGLAHDQYLSFEKNFRDCQGEFWGLTKTELLQGGRFNEGIVSWESILWFKIAKRARKYYIHRALRLYHTEDSDRISKLATDSASDRQREYLCHRAMLDEKEFLHDLRQLRPDQYKGIIFSAGLMLIEKGERTPALQCAAKLLLCRGGAIKGIILFAGAALGNGFLQILKKGKLFFKSMLM